MTQQIYIDNLDGRGEQDYTTHIETIGTIKSDKDVPSIVTFSMYQNVNVDWVVPQRGSIVTIFDDRFISRLPRVRDGVVWTGLVTEDAEPVLLGKKVDGVEAYGYNVNCTSDDYRTNIQVLPNKTYINKHRGEIIIDLLQGMFIDNQYGLFNTDNVLPGGLERIYQVDAGKKFTDLVAEFCKADGFTYYVLDNCFVYTPAAEVFPGSNDPVRSLVLDKYDPRFTIDGLQIKPINTAVANDITVLGADSPGAFVRETFISDGYTPNFQLAFMPFGVDAAILIQDDFTGDTVDDTRWEKVDPGIPTAYIQPFDGSLNITGGPNLVRDGIGRCFLRSRRGLELSGILEFRDGEIFFPPSPKGGGIIGGLYTASDATLFELDIFCGWQVYLNAGVDMLPDDPPSRRIYPRGPDGLEPNYIEINIDHHYVLRRTMVFEHQIAPVTAYTSAVNNYQQQFFPPAPPQQCTITWSFDEIIDDDPIPAPVEGDPAVVNVHTVTTTLLTKTYQDVPDFAIYAPVVSYDMHLVMNYVEVDSPQQVAVTIDAVPIRLGNMLDGAKAIITTDSDIPRLAWYSTQLPEIAVAAGIGVDPSVATTIPPVGSKVEIQYWQNGPCSARVLNRASIANERVRLRDTGVRQMIVRAGDVKPIPKTTEECQALALAMISDRTEPRFEGSYNFDTLADSTTDLIYWPMPGDYLETNVQPPDRAAIFQYLMLTSVTALALGPDAWRFECTFGALNRESEVLRQLVLRRATSIDDPVLTDVVPLPFEVVADLVPPTDPTIIVTEILPSSFILQITTSSDATGFEVRKDNTGWGQTNYITRIPLAFAQAAGLQNYTTATIGRTSRDTAFYIRPYRAGASPIYAERSAFVRVQYPLKNVMQVTKVERTIGTTTFDIVITFPLNADLAGVTVRQDTEVGAVIYKGDGVAELAKADGVVVIAGTSTLTLRIPNDPPAVAYTIWVTPYDIVGAESIYGTTWPIIP